MGAAQEVAWKSPEAIRYNAWERSRPRRWGVGTEGRRKSSKLRPHWAISTRTIGRLPDGYELERPPPILSEYPRDENSGSQPDRGFPPLLGFVGHPIGTSSVSRLRSPHPCPTPRIPASGAA